MRSDHFRVVLNPTVTSGDVSSRGSWGGWSLENCIFKSEDTFFELIYSSPAGEAEIHYIEDWELGVKYVVVKGPELQQVLADVRGRLPVIELPELIGAAREARTAAEQKAALCKLAAGAPPQFDQECFEIFDSALANGSVEVQNAVMQGVLYMGWPEFVPTLASLDVDGNGMELRENARITRELLEYAAKAPAPY
jgi:hypothetical protein